MSDGKCWYAFVDECNEGGGQTGFYMSLSCDNRKLATAVGVATNDYTWRFPWGDNGFLQHLKSMRNATVDNIIANHTVANDPRGQVTIEAAQKDMDDMKMSLPTKEWNKVRTDKFFMACVPEVVNVVYPAFVSKNGKRMAEQPLSVISTPDEFADVKIKFSEDVFDWMAYAAPSCQHEFKPMREAIAANEEDQDTRPKITEPHVRYAYRDSSKGYRIYMRYRSASGNMIQKFSGASAENVHEKAAELEQRFRTLHHPAQADDDNGGSDDGDVEAHDAIE